MDGGAGWRVGGRRLEEGEGSKVAVEERRGEYGVEGRRCQRAEGQSKAKRNGGRGPWVELRTLYDGVIDEPTEPTNLIYESTVERCSSYDGPYTNPRMSILLLMTDSIRTYL